MKKYIFTLLILAGSCQMVCAQFLTTGIKAGTNIGAASVKDVPADWERDGFTVGVHAGLFAKLSLGPLFVQPEAYYTFTEAHLEKGNVQIGGSEELKLDFHRLDVPVLAGLQLGPGFRINAGPFASLLINTNGESNARQDLDNFIEDSYRRALWGWQAGIGFDFGRVTLDARYETTQGNLRDYDPALNPAADYLPREQEQEQVIVSLGYKFK